MRKRRACLKLRRHRRRPRRPANLLPDSPSRPLQAARNQVICLNVGGQLFHTTSTTLTSTTGHYLSRLFAAGGEGELQGTLKDDGGCPFIDR